MEYINSYFSELERILYRIDPDSLLSAIKILSDLKSNKGRLFIVGVGGSAANAAHAACDFKKFLSLQVFCPTDNVYELTANINDINWSESYVKWLQSFTPKFNDVLMVLSVGGGKEDNNSPSFNLVKVIKYAKSKKMKIISIVGIKQGYAGTNSDVVINIPVRNFYLTPITESVQVFILHLFASHPSLKNDIPTWEKILKNC